MSGQRGKKDTAEAAAIGDDGDTTQHALCADH